MNEEKMRAEFEVAAKTAQGLDVTRLPHGGYRSFATHQAWWAWQASRAAMQGEPVGWVNSDELDNMLDDRTATLSPVRTGFHGKPVYAASQPAEQQPAEGEEIMVNTPYDVFILPLQPSGLGGKGPRFVVHVPGPKQPAAVDALVEALEAIQKASTLKGVPTGAQVGAALGRIAAICDVTLAPYRKGVES